MQKPEPGAPPDKSSNIQRVDPADRERQPRGAEPGPLTLRTLAVEPEGQRLKPRRLAWCTVVARPAPRISPRNSRP